jgi:hypothetical protein
MRNTSVFIASLAAAVFFVSSLTCSGQITTNGKIAFTSNRDGNLEIYVMNSDGKQQVRLTSNTAKDFLPSSRQTEEESRFSASDPPIR